MNKGPLYNLALIIGSRNQIDALDSTQVQITKYRSNVFFRNFFENPGNA
jgi:hypothetical protein